MKLQRFKVTNFRSVIDSGWIYCDEVTTLVGVNESGKSNILLALWKLNPVTGGNIDILHDMPVSKLAELRDKKDKTFFIEAVFTLGKHFELFRDKFGMHFQDTDEILLKRNYDGQYAWDFCDKEWHKQILSLTEPSRGESGENIQPKYTYQDILNFIKEYLPKFVYYSNYGNLASEVYLPHAIKWLKGETITGFPTNEDQIRTIKVLFDYVNLKPEEILKLGENAAAIAQQEGHRNSPNKEDIMQVNRNKEQRSLLLQSASAKLTKDFKDWWKQGNYTFKLDADGDYFRIWVADEKRPAAVPLGLRSTGLQWFLSFFLVFLVECQGNNKNAILLLDEAGLTLHPLAQKDLSLFFNKLAETNPIINSTHSPFIIDTDNIDRCRVVYSDDHGETVVSENLRAGSEKSGLKSVYAVHAALGLSVSDVMLQGSQIVIVEGVSDQYYLSAIKNVLIRNQRITPQKEILFAPAGGVRGVPGITSLVASKTDDLPFVILDSDSSGVDFRRKLENGIYKDSKARIICIKDITSIDASEVEDLIPFDIIEKKILTFLQVDDEEEESFEYESGKPLIPQIEAYTKEQGIELPFGWKVDLAKTFKKKMLGNRSQKITDAYLKMWEDLFKRLSS